MNRKILLSSLILAVVLIAACTSQQASDPSQATGHQTASIDAVAESFVKLVLEVGLYNSDVVDAYYGPEEWRPAAVEEGSDFPYQALSTRAATLQSKMSLIDTSSNTALEKARHDMMVKQLTAIATKIDIIAGKHYTFNEESKRLYDAVSPQFEWSHFDQLLAELDAKVPGEGSLTDRLNAYRKRFEIPADKLELTFKTAISEARERTKAHINLPENENFVLEFVTDKPWGGYNYYQGNAQSLIQVNTDFPVPIQRVVDLAAHEGYPGHHVYNVLLEQNLVNDKGWVEYSILPLFSPQALIAEGSANYGIEVAFPGDSRIQYEKDVLFPLAGLDANEADRYYEVLELVGKLNYASNETARGYLNGTLTRAEAKALVQKYGLRSDEYAESWFKFVDKYRSYVINYNVGMDAVADFMQRNGATADNPERRWAVFADLLRTPNTASSIAEQ